MHAVWLLSTHRLCLKDPRPSTPAIASPGLSIVQHVMMYDIAVTKLIPSIPLMLLVVGGLDKGRS